METFEKRICVHQLTLRFPALLWREGRKLPNYRKFVPARRRKISAQYSLIKQILKSWHFFKGFELEFKKNTNLIKEKSLYFPLAGFNRRLNKLFGIFFVFSLDQSIKQGRVMKYFIYFLFLILPLTTMAKDSGQKRLQLNAEGIEKLEIDCGPGFLKVTGDPEVREISVIAEIEPSSVDWDRAGRYVKLKLTRSGKNALLICNVKEGGFWEWLFEREELKINLTVTLPPSVKLEIDDGSGDIKVTDMTNDISLDDGSGDVILKNINGDVKIDDGSGGVVLKNVVGDITLDDGSGDLEIYRATGALKIDDSSGDVTISEIQGNVNLDDGSGNIDITLVQGDINIDDSSGNIDVKEVYGTVIIDDGSGDMRLSKIDGDVIIEDDGGGDVFTNQISGKVINKTED